MFYYLILYRTAKSPVCFCKNKHKNNLLGVNKKYIRFYYLCKMVKIRWVDLFLRLDTKQGGLRFEVGHNQTSF